MELVMHRASFLMGGSEIGVYHATAKDALVYLRKRVGEVDFSFRVLPKKVLGRVGLYSFTKARQLLALCQPLTLNLAENEIYTIVFWSEDTPAIQVAYSIEDVAMLVRQQISVDEYGQIEEIGQKQQMRLFSTNGQLLVTVSWEQAQKYRLYLEVLKNLKKEKGS